MACRLGQWSVVLIFVFAFTGCDPLPVSDYIDNSIPNQTDNQPATTFENADVTISDPTIIMGSFNIQYFGVTKMSRPEVVNVLVDIVRRFDIIAIQELRDGDEKVIWEFLDLVNADGSTFEAAVGEKQGYTLNGKTSRYFEQAVYIYDKTKLELISPTYVAPNYMNQNNQQAMHRTPYVGHFRCTNVPPEQAFSFVLMNVHVDPDTVHPEFVAMQNIIPTIYGNHRGEDDFILIGDLNEEPDKFAGYQWMQTQFAAIPSSWKTNTRLKECYDNIVFDANYTSEFTMNSGVLNIMNEYGLTLDQALKVSDHLPVWAVFSCLEAPQAALTKNQPVGVVR